MYLDGILRPPGYATGNVGPSVAEPLVRFHNSALLLGGPWVFPKTRRQVVVPWEV